MNHYVFIVTIRDRDAPTWDALSLSEQVFTPENWEKAHDRLEHWAYIRELELQPKEETELC